MFGESFLAAPVVKESATKWDVYLPAYKYTAGPYWLDVGSTFQVSRGRRWANGGTYHPSVEQEAIVDWGGQSVLDPLILRVL